MLTNPHLNLNLAKPSHQEIPTTFRISHSATPLSPVFDTLDSVCSTVVPLISLEVATSMHPQRSNNQFGAPRFSEENNPDERDLSSYLQASAFTSRVQPQNSAFSTEKRTMNLGFNQQLLAPNDIAARQSTSEYSDLPSQPQSYDQQPSAFENYNGVNPGLVPVQPNFEYHQNWIRPADPSYFNFSNAGFSAQPSGLPEQPENILSSNMSLSTAAVFPPFPQNLPSSSPSSSSNTALQRSQPSRGVYEQQNFAHSNSLSRLLDSFHQTPPNHFSFPSSAPPPSSYLFSLQSQLAGLNPDPFRNSLSDMDAPRKDASLSASPSGMAEQILALLRKANPAQSSAADRGISLKTEPSNNFDPFLRQFSARGPYSSSLTDALNHLNNRPQHIAVPDIPVPKAEGQSAAAPSFAFDMGVRDVAESSVPNLDASEPRGAAGFASASKSQTSSSVEAPKKKKKTRKTHTCEYCGLKFLGRSSLVTHIHIHTGATPFKCDTCGKSFRQRGTLTTHMRIHTGIQPYSCMYCQTKFRHRGSMLRHGRVCHANPNRDTSKPASNIRQTYNSDSESDSHQSSQPNRAQPDSHAVQTLAFLAAQDSTNNLK